MPKYGLWWLPMASSCPGGRILALNSFMMAASGISGFQQLPVAERTDSRLSCSVAPRWLPVAPIDFQWLPMVPSGFHLPNVCSNNHLAPYLLPVVQ